MTPRHATETEPPERDAAAGDARSALNSGLRRAALLAGLGRAVRETRTERGLSQQAVAARAGLSPRFVAQLEAGEGNISVAKLAELARALDTSVARLLSDGEHGATDRTTDGTTDGDGERAGGMVGRPGSAGEPDAGNVIALVGLRGAGKSTLGPLLAGALGRRYVELDEQIQELSGLAVSEIFELHGEDYYRAAELRALEALLAAGKPAVVAVSGGAVTNPALFETLKARTLLVWVKASPEQHMQRVVSQGDRRPMADRPDAMAELRALLRTRAPYYEQARLVADTARGSPEACVGRLLAELERLAPA